MDTSRFLIVVVIYECEIEESVTLKKLKLINETVCAIPEVLVYDNSLKSKLHANNFQSFAFYKHNPANGGVAAGYNYALAFGKMEAKDWLILFDQDTDLSLDYFEQLERSLVVFPHQKLFCPTVRSGNSIVSPTYCLLEKPLKPKKLNTGLLSSSYYTIINSGLAIQLDLMESLGGYDKDLPLDFSDHYFFRKYKESNRRFVLTGAVNLHDLSSENETSVEEVYKRFKKYCCYTSVYSNKIHNPFPIFWLYMRAIKLTFKFNTFEFIKFILFKR